MDVGTSTWTLLASPLLKPRAISVKEIRAWALGLRNTYIQLKLIQQICTKPYKLFGLHKAPLQVCVSYVELQGLTLQVLSRPVPLYLMYLTDLCGLSPRETTTIKSARI